MVRTNLMGLKHFFTNRGVPDPQPEDLARIARHVCALGRAKAASLRTYLS